MREFEGLKEKLEAIRVPKELLKMSRSGEIKIKKTEPMEVAFAIHKGSYSKVGETFHKMMPWIMEKGYIVAGPPINIFHNDPMVTPEDELITEVQFPIRKIT
jgi:AraC family transcriptional regulator